MKHTLMIELPAKKQVPETSIYVEIYTQSGQLGQRDVLILMPGGPGNDHTVCDYGNHSFAESILPYVDVILFDPRGCGKSSKSAVEYCTMDHYIDDVEAIHQHFQLQSKQSILMGVSYGAIAALGYATRYPDSFKKLILVCGAASAEHIQEARQTLAKIGTPEQREMGEAILTGQFTLSNDTVAAYYETMGPLYSTTFKPGLPTPSISYNLELANFGFQTFLKNFDHRPHLSKVKAQTLIIAGEHDWITSKQQAEIIQRGVAGSQLIVYQDCSHMIWIDQWERFIGDIIQLIKR